MKITQVPLYVAVTGLMLPWLTLAGERIDRTEPVDSDAKIYIETQRGEVTIRTWDKNEFKVVGELDDEMKELVFKNRGNSLRFVVELPKRWGKGWNSDDWKGNGSDLEFFIPKGSELKFEGVQVDVDVAGVEGGSRIETVNGDIRAEALKGELRLDTVNGDVDALNLEGEIQFETVNGDINDTASKGQVRFEAVNGDINSTTLSDDIRIENVNGDIDLKLQAVSRLTINTVNADSEVSIQTVKPGANISFESVSGDAEFLLPAALSARVRIETHGGGRINNKLTSDSPEKAKYGPSRWLKFTAGQGDADIEFDTVSGRITLRKN